MYECIFVPLRKMYNFLLFCILNTSIELSRKCGFFIHVDESFHYIYKYANRINCYF